MGLYETGLDMSKFREIKYPSKSCDSTAELEKINILQKVATHLHPVPSPTILDPHATQHPK